ncbi:type II toxin-antitoxin system HicA family toxin [Microcoleus sp. D2_18a_D3]|uniref:type II toxin-antitoxin system HicA family toxin n=1 Tax=Microcoleus sp. D2_18a_D3 TaxID=3055330 RepID=UPI002FD64270
MPIHGNKSLKVRLLRHLLKQAGLLENIHQNTSTVEESNSDNKAANESDLVDEEEE